MPNLPVDELDSNSVTVEMASFALGRDNLAHVPYRFAQLLREGAWRAFRSRDFHKEVRYAEGEFEKFLKTDWDEGLGRKDGIAGVIRIVKAIGGEDAPEALRLLQAEERVAGKVGRPEKGDNVTLKSNKRGNSRRDTLARLKRDHPKLAAQVVAGKLSAHKAAIQAGFRKRVLQAVATPAALAKAIRKELSSEEIATLIKLLPMPTPAQRKAQWAEKVISPTTEARRQVGRVLADLPVDVTPGARQVALLTMFRSAQVEFLQPVMDALKELEAITDWSGGHLVAETIHWNWKTAPFKHYDSFEDFYRRELEQTWGKWKDLQQTYQDRIGGKINDTEVVGKARRKS